MQLTDINILLSVATGVIGIYAGYKKALKEAQDKYNINAITNGYSLFRKCVRYF